ncbi:MAG: hypothetical protein GY941_21635 [Planctomycetes bacterium]|nr:hypothetical protein [Planctomycetota bacterium]
MIDKNWKCTRCGDCCRYIASEDEWTYALITDEQKKLIEAELEPTENGCQALVKRDGKWACLGQYLFGIEGKPVGCNEYTHRCGMTAKVKDLIISRRLT